MGALVLIIYIVCAFDCTDDAMAKGDCWGWFYSYDKYCTAYNNCDHNPRSALIEFGIAIGICWIVAAAFAFFTYWKRPTWVLFSGIGIIVAFIVFIAGFSVVMDSIRMLFFHFAASEHNFESIGYWSSESGSSPEKQLRSSRLFSGISGIAWIIGIAVITEMVLAWKYEIGKDTGADKDKSASQVPVTTSV